MGSVVDHRIRPSWILVVLCFALFAACSDGDERKQRALAQLKEDYLQKLDDWVADGAPQEQWGDVGNACGMLMEMHDRDRSYTGSSETPADDEYLFRLAFCTDITKARVIEPSREEWNRFTEICANRDETFFQVICERSNWHP